MDLASDLAMMIRNISSEVSGGSLRSTALYGRVVGYHQDSNNMVVAIPHYAQANGTVPQIHVPIGCFMAGSGYGDFFYAETGQLCLLLVVEADTGDAVHGFLLCDADNLPPNLEGDSGTPNAPLEVGERIIVGRNGQVFRFSSVGDILVSAAGNVRLGSRSANFGTTPVAVEGTGVVPNSAFLTWITSVQTALSSLGFPIAPPWPVTPGSPFANIQPGQGAQTVLAPGPGES